MNSQTSYQLRGTVLLIALGITNFILLIVSTYIVFAGRETQSLNNLPKSSELHQPSFPKTKIINNIVIDNFEKNSTAQNIRNYFEPVISRINTDIFLLDSRIKSLSDSAIACIGYSKLRATECILRSTENSQVSTLIGESGIFNIQDRYLPVISTYPTKGDDRLTKIIHLSGNRKGPFLAQLEGHLYYFRPYTSIEAQKYAFFTQVSDEYTKELLSNYCIHKHGFTISVGIIGDGSVLSGYCEVPPDNLLLKRTELSLGLNISFLIPTVKINHKDIVSFPPEKSYLSPMESDTPAENHRKNSQYTIWILLVLESITGFLSLYFSYSMKRYLEKKEKNSIDSNRVLVNLHETSNEILTLRTLNSMLRFSDSDHHNKKIHNLISSNIDNFLSFIDNLNISLSNKAEISLKDADFNVFNFFKEVIEIFRLQAENKGLNFSSFIQIEPLSIWRGDTDSLRQVISNILGNAIKYTENGSVEIKVSVDKNDGMLTVEVDDTGRGVVQDDLQKIFHPFVRGENVDSNVSGLGVGLYVCKMIADAMSGSIKCQQLESGGTRFTFIGFLGKSKTPLSSEPFKGLVAVIGCEQGDTRTDLVQVLREAGMLVDVADDSFTLGAVCERAKYLWNRLDVVVISETLPAQGAKETMSRLASVDAIKGAIICFMESASEIDGFSDSYPYKTVRIPALSSTQDILRLISINLEETSEVVLSVPVVDDTNLRFNRRILLVEDNPINVTLIKQYIDRKEWSVITVSSGEDAIHQMEKNKFDLVLMDLRLPGISGCETTRRILELHGHTISAVVGITAHRTEDVYKECSDAGMMTVISKTKGLPKLPEAIETAFLMSRLKPTVTPQPSLDRPASLLLDPNLRNTFDLSMFLEFRQALGDEEARKILSGLFNELPGIIDEVKNYIDSENLNAAYNLIHGNLPIIYSIGGFPLYDYLFEIEEICSSEDHLRKYEAIELCAKAVSILEPYYNTIEAIGWAPMITDTNRPRRA
ncbi:hybrid sensor histidine kinase/response regulator [Acetobacter sicerae]|uniref:hybrid sensor histidine kinase/response regulator n=1 Tax=Acetobacter sicerae TaxID=85325 RepID=UPI00156A91DB|nr:ATP-binding protein [Acetobacter sicerae]NHN93782.1 response regulator [Acetobacter sicerae]